MAPVDVGPGTKVVFSIESKKWNDNVLLSSDISFEASFSVEKAPWLAGIDEKDEVWNRYQGEKKRMIREEKKFWDEMKG